MRKSQPTPKKSQPTPKKPVGTIKKVTKKVTTPKNASKSAPSRSTKPMPGYGVDTRNMG